MRRPVRTPSLVFTKEDVVTAIEVAASCDPDLYVDDDVKALIFKAKAAVKAASGTIRLR